MDSLSFIPGSLASIVDLKCKNIETEGPEVCVPLTAQMTKEKYGDSMLRFVGRKQTYPYSLCKSVNELK